MTKEDLIIFSGCVGCGLLVVITLIAIVSVSLWAVMRVVEKVTG